MNYRQLHNLSVEVTRLRTLTDHVYAAVNESAGKLDILLGQRDAVRRIVRKITIETRPKGGDSMPDDPLGQVAFQAEQLRTEIKEIVQRCDFSADALLMLGILRADLERFCTTLDSLGS